MPGPPAPTTPPARRHGGYDLLVASIQSARRGWYQKKGAHARGGGGGKQEEEESPEDRFFGTEPKRAHFHDYPEKGRGGSVFHDYRAVGGNRRRDPPKKTTVTCSCWYIIQCSTHYLCVLPMFRSSTSTCDRANITTS